MGNCHAHMLTLSNSRAAPARTSIVEEEEIKDVFVVLVKIWVSSMPPSGTVIGVTRPDNRTSVKAAVLECVVAVGPRGATALTSMLARWPKLPSPTRIDRSVETPDIFSTSLMRSIQRTESRSRSARFVERSKSLAGQSRWLPNRLASRDTRS